MVSKSESTISACCMLACQLVVILEILSCYKQQCHSPFALPKNYFRNSFEKLCLFIKFNWMVFKLSFQLADVICGRVKSIVFRANITKPER